MNDELETVTRSQILLTTFGFLFSFLLSVLAAAGEEAHKTLELPSTAIFSKGLNEYQSDVLNITKGRGSTIGWYVSAIQADKVRVFIEYSCTKSLNQDYQLSFDGQDRFWEVSPTAESEWRQAEIGLFTIRAGLPILVLLVPPSGTKYEQPFRFRKLILEGSIPDNLSLLPQTAEPPAPDSTPGFGQKLSDVHPALEVRDLRDETLTMRVSGMAMRSASELIFTTWDGDLYSLDLNGVSENSEPPFRRIAQGLSEPMGLAIANSRIFVTEKNQATELIDEDGDGAFETYRCVSHDWPCTMDYHEYLFGAVVQGNDLIFSSSVAMNSRAIDNRQAPLRGSVIKVDVDSGKTEIVAGGLRTPDGIGVGPGGSILVTDNQGEWLPGNKLIHVKQDAFFQFRSRPPWHPMDRPRATPPAVWLPQGEIAASPTQPILVPQSWGPYAGQVLFGDAAFGGLQRVFLEEVEGQLQGVAFPFSQGFQHLFHRFVFAPNGDLYAGGIARGKDTEFIDHVSGLTKLQYSGENVFEPLAARLKSNGIELEFTMPLAEKIGWDPNEYFVTQWGYQATQTYGGQKVRHRRAEISSASVSPDRRRVFLEIPSLVEEEVLHVRLPESMFSETGHSLWTGDLWYTVNRIPKHRSGKRLQAPENKIASPPSFHFSEGNEGRTLYRNYCAACHSLDGSRVIGPTFLGLHGSKRNVRDTVSGNVQQVVADTAYLRESILDPNARLVDSYPENLMPPIGAALSDAQLKSLLGYLVKVSKPEFAKRELAIRPKTVKAWSMNDFAEVLQKETFAPLSTSAISRGKTAFLKAQCIQCHSVSGMGASFGPDLTETVKKIRGEKLLKQIIEPSSDIHPKYQATQFLLESGNVLVGSIIKEDDDSIEVAPSLLTPQSVIVIAKADIERRKDSTVSAMPHGLVDILTKREILDMLQFLEAGPAPVGKAKLP